MADDGCRVRISGFANQLPDHILYLTAKSVAPGKPFHQTRQDICSEYVKYIPVFLNEILSSVVLPWHQVITRTILSPILMVKYHRLVTFTWVTNKLLYGMSTTLDGEQLVGVYCHKGRQTMLPSQSNGSRVTDFFILSL